MVPTINETLLNCMVDRKAVVTLDMGETLETGRLIVLKGEGMYGVKVDKTVLEFKSDRVVTIRGNTIILTCEMDFI